MSDMKLIMENWEQFVNEAELAPAMYDALKKAGKLPPGATRKGGDQPQAGEVKKTDTGAAVKRFVDATVKTLNPVVGKEIANVMVQMFFNAMYRDPSGKGVNIPENTRKTLQMYISQKFGQK